MARISRLHFEKPKISRQGGTKIRPLESFVCTCGGEGLEHKSTCPRGLRIRVRIKKGLPLT